MTRILDILENFLNLHGYTYVRLDGSVKVEMRQRLVDKFNLNKKVSLYFPHFIRYCIMSAAATDLIKSFRTYALYQNVIFLSAIILTDLALLIPLRGKLDKAAKVTLGIYFLSFSLRVLNQYNKIMGDAASFFLTTYNLVSFWCTNLIWGALFYFIFEMAHVRLLLRVQETKVLVEKEDHLRKTKVVVLGYLAVYAALYGFIDLISREYDDLYVQHS